jgi:hypothetical protein
MRLSQDHSELLIAIPAAKHAQTRENALRPDTYEWNIAGGTLLEEGLMII